MEVCLVREGLVRRKVGRRREESFIFGGVDDVGG